MYEFWSFMPRFSNAEILVRFRFNSFGMHGKNVLDETSLLIQIQPISKYMALKITLIIKIIAETERKKQIFTSINNASKDRERKRKTPPSHVCAVRSFKRASARG